MGRVQRWGDPVDELRPGDVGWIPPGQKHWHGASPTTGMTHIAIVERLDGKSVDWMEKVTDEQFGAPLRPRPAAAAARDAAPAGQPTRAQRLMGDVAPKLAELTDDVLYGDVWERPQLSPRDRSLVTISASRKDLGLSKQKWLWMSERNVDALAALFHEKADAVATTATDPASTNAGAVMSPRTGWRRRPIPRRSCPCRARSRGPSQDCRGDVLERGEPEAVGLPQPIGRAG